MTSRPPDPPGGQDDRPDAKTVIEATVRLLTDVSEVLEREDHHDLLLRVIAFRSVLRRLHKRLEAGEAP